MSRRLVPAVAAVLAGLAPVLLHAAPTEKGTLRPRSIEEVVDAIASETGKSVGREKVQVCWLLDTAPSMREFSILSKLADRLETAFGPMNNPAWKDKVLLSVCSMGTEGKPPAVICPPTPDLAAAVKAVRALADLSDDSYKNCLDSLRKAATTLATTKGRRLLVLVSLDNGDNEDEPEKTVEMLKSGGVTLHAVSREALYSDPYGEIQNRLLGYEYDRQKTAKPFELTGQDTGASEYPVGWIFDRMGAANTAPSGYGTYFLSRLAMATGGTYSLFCPYPEGDSYCREACCTLCEGSHTSCRAVYDPAKLAEFAPSLDSRETYYVKLGGLPLARALFEAWKTAYDGGLCGLGSPWEAKGNSFAPTKEREVASRMISPRSSSYRYEYRWPEEVPWTAWEGPHYTHQSFLVGWYGKSFGTGEMGVLSGGRSLKACDAAIRLLEGASRTDATTPMARRILASADTLLCQLYATRFNLNQYQLLRDEVKPLDLVPVPGANVLARSSLLDFRRQVSKYSVIYTDYRNALFCHGPDRVADVHFLGGAPVRKEQLAVIERVEKNIQKYRGTPWEVLSRRIGLVVLRPSGYEMTPMKGEAVTIKPDRKLKGKEASDDTPPPPPSFTPPSRSNRPGQASSPGGRSSVATPSGS